MARTARAVAPGHPHHVCQRGNKRSTVFVTDADRNKYLALLKHYSQKHDLAVWAYCLMDNHVHLVVVPEKEDSLSKTFKHTHQFYSRYFNNRFEYRGHLWQNRFFSCVLDESHMWTAIRYVENNPVRAGMVVSAEAYEWSSAAAHCRLRKDVILSREMPYEQRVVDWSGWLKNNDQERTDSIRRLTCSGRPCGAVDFIKKLERKMGRELLPKKAGRKLKTRRGKKNKVSL